MKVFLEILGVVAGFIVFTALIIIPVEIEKSEKWDSVYRKKGRDD